MPHELTLQKVLAKETGVKNATFDTLKDIEKVLGKRDFVTGLNRTYTRINDESEQLPDEPGLVAVRVKDQIGVVHRTLTKVWDIAATKEWGNAKAAADLTIGDETIPNVPVLLLVRLDEELRELHTFVGRLPVVDAPVEQWHVDENDGLYKTDPVTLRRTMKVPKVVVKYPATKEHQAQTELYFDDEAVGHWHATKMSSALLPSERDRLLFRVQEVREAVRIARAAANETMVEEHAISGVVLEHIFG